MANKFTGSNISQLNTALLTAEAAEDQVEIELLKHIALKSERKKLLYKYQYKKKTIFLAIFRKI